MSKINFSKKIINYIVYAINSVMAGLCFILMQRNFFSENRSGEELFSPWRTFIFICASLSCFLLFTICTMGESRKKIEHFIEKLGTHPLFLTVLVSALFRMWYLSHFKGYILYYDTKTYTNYPYNIFLGQTDIFRTPGYPYFLKLIHYITGNGENDITFYHTVTYIQTLLSLASIVILYLAGRKLFKNKYTLSFACFLYGIAPCVFNWDVIVLTETLSLFCTVLLIYFVFSYLAKPSVLKAVWLGIYSFGMIMIRPTFIYLIAIFAVFFIARFIFNRKERKKAIAGLLSVVVCIGMLFGYCSLNLKNYDYFAVSSVNNTVNNLYIVMMHDDWIDNEEYPELSRYIRTSMEIVGDGNWVSNIIEVAPEIFAYEEIDSYVSSCIENHKSEYLKYTMNKFYYLLDDDIATQYTPLPDEAANFSAFSETALKWTFPFRFFDCYVMVAVSLVFAVIVLIRKKRICWHIIGLCAIIFTHIFVSIYGSMAEFGRLSIMVVPAVILLLFYFVDYIVNAIKKRRVFCFDDNNSSAISISKPKTNYEINDL